MKLFIQGKKEVTLNPKDFVRQGGEGSIYSQGDIAFKVYTNPQKMLPTGKIQELSSLASANIVCPLDILLEKNNNRPVGYTMMYIQDSFSLCQVFSKSFKRRNNISFDKISSLVLRMRETIEFIHSKQTLLVDLNELNFLVDRQCLEMFFIDTDSYQTPHFPATALMTSVRDWHTKGFSELSDWFSFAVVSFQLFVGIHPYRGKHPDYGDNFEERMKRNISVFDAKVRLPPACEPFDVIPEMWRDWYRSVFAGARLKPPGAIQNAIRIQISAKVLQKIGRLEFELINEFSSDILGVFSSAGTEVIIVNDEIHVGGKLFPGIQSTSVAFSPQTNRPFAIKKENNKICIYDISQNNMLCVFDGKNYMCYDRRVYIQFGGSIQEVQFINVGNGYLTPTIEVARVMEKSSQMFDGVIIQELLCGDSNSQKRRNNVLVFPRPGTCYQVPVPELDQYRVVDAKFDSGVLMVIGENQGQYDRCVLRFDAKHENYDYRCVPDVGNVGLNFVVLDSGVCVCLNEEGELEIFRKEKGSTSHSTMKDLSINVDLQLYKNGINLLGVQGNKLYRIKK